MKHLILALCSIIALNTHSIAQDCGLTLTGVIVDEHDGKPLAYADVWIDQTKQFVASNSKGEFALSMVCAGELTLMVAHLGCDTLIIKLNLVADSHLVLQMEHHAELLALVKIEALKPHQDIASRTELEGHKLERMQARNFSEALEDELGVQMSQTGGNIAKPMVHGLTGNRVAIMNNGVLLKGQQWGTEHAPEIDPYSAEEIEVIYGASSLRYGPEALAGAIIANNKRDTVKELHGWLHMHGATNGRGGNVAFKLRGSPSKKIPLYIYTQATLGRMGHLSAPDYVLDNTGSSDQHWQVGTEWMGKKAGARLDYRQFNTQLGILSFAHIGNLTDLREVIDRGQPLGANKDFSYSINRPFQQVAHEVGAASFWWRPKLETKITLDLNRQFNRRQEFDNSTFSGEEADLQYELTTHQAQLVVEHRLSSLFKTEFGTTAQRQANTYEGRFFIPNYLSYEGGGFIIQHLQWREHELEAGLRYDQRWQQAFMYRNEVLYSPIRQFQGLSLNVGYAIDKGKYRVSSNIARGWRPPAINELYSNGLHHGAASIEIGDENLQEERLWSWLSQLDFKLMEREDIKWVFMLRTHLSYYDQFIYLVPTGTPVLTIRGAFPTFSYRGVEAILGGIDASVKTVYRNKVEASVGLELLRAQDLQSNSPLLFIPPDRLDARLRYKLSNSDDGRYVQIHGIGVREQNRFPPGVDYALPPKAFLLFGGEIGWTFEIREKSKIITAINLSNAFNESYRSYTNRLRYFADEMGRNVSLVVRIPINQTNQTL